MSAIALRSSSAVESAKLGSTYYPAYSAGVKTPACFQLAICSVKADGEIAMIPKSYARQCVVLCLGWSLGFALTKPAALSQVPVPQETGATEFHCVIEPQQLVKLASSVVGVVARLDVDRGDIVRRGQVLGKLEDAVEASALSLAKARATNEYVSKSVEARLDFLRSKSKRVNELYGKAFSSQDALEEAEAAAKVAEQQLKEAELNREIAYLQIRHDEEVLNQRTLRSPLDGVVVERLLQPGEYRNEQTPIMTLAQIDQLRVEVFVPTAYYGRIQTGSKAQVRPEKPIGGVHIAVVTVVDRVLDAASGTFGVRLALPNADLRLPAGISCTIAFEMLPPAETQDTTSVTVPEAFIGQFANTPYASMAHARLDELRKGQVASVESPAQATPELRPAAVADLNVAPSPAGPCGERLVPANTIQATPCLPVQQEAVMRTTAPESPRSELPPSSADNSIGEASKSSGKMTASAAANNTVATRTVLPEAEAPTAPEAHWDRRTLILEIKKELKRVGCFAGRLDDKWSTADIRTSVQQFTRYAKLPSIQDQPEPDFLDAIRGKSHRVCPLKCNSREVEKDGHCQSQIVRRR
jgi:RND family efflux transporter MFP subunit